MVLDNKVVWDNNVDVTNRPEEDISTRKEIVDTQLMSKKIFQSH